MAKALSAMLTVEALEVASKHPTNQNSPKKRYINSSVESFYETGQSVQQDAARRMMHRRVNEKVPFSNLCHVHIMMHHDVWLRCIVRIRLLHSSNASSCWINVYAHAIDFDSVSNILRLSKPAVSTTSDCPCRVRKECVLLLMSDTLVVPLPIRPIL